MQTEPVSHHTPGTHFWRTVYNAFRLQSSCLPIPVQAQRLLWTSTHPPRYGQSGTVGRTPFHEVSSFGIHSPHFYPQLWINYPDQCFQECSWLTSPATGRGPLDHHSKNYTIALCTPQKSSEVYVVWWFLKRERICRGTTCIRVIRLLHQSLALCFAFEHRTTFYFLMN